MSSSAAADLTAALALVSKLDEEGHDSGLLDVIGRGALAELLRRFNTPALRKELPANGLLTFATAFIKLKERQLAKSGAPLAAEDILAEIESAGLPDTRKRELLIAELEANWRRKQRAIALLDEIEERMGYETAALPEVPSLV